MREIKLPAYPIYTFDPMMSLWSMSDKLYDSNVKMWTAHDKPITGYIVVDGKAYRFMGAGKEPVLPQTKVEMGLTSTKYFFENAAVRAEITFTTPFILSDLKLVSRPVAYTTVTVVSKDEKKHFIDVIFSFSEKIVYRGYKRLTVGWTEQLAGGNIGFLERRRQKPIYDAGDILDADWGTICVAGQAKIVFCSPFSLKKYLAGSPIKTGRGFRKNLLVEKSCLIDKKTSLSYYFCFGWDDGFSINYFGEKTCGYWKKFYPDIRMAVKDALNTYDETMKRCFEEDKKAEADIIPNFGLSYYTLLLASFRQSIAAHKLVEADGKPAFISKENSSNGCCATVDVTYPSAPLFLAENPTLLRAMLEPIFKFARIPTWKYDFAPHDAGVYPYVMGQVYGLNVKYILRAYKDMKRHPVFMYSADDMYRYNCQMPVEESANMIILVAAYFNQTGDKNYVLENADLLQKWADYLVKQGIDLELQLSTDDFSGRLPKNVNLAIKSIIAIALWGKLASKIGISDGKAYLDKAKDLAGELKQKADRGDHYAIVLDQNGWSTKYNLVWDKIFALGLFGEEAYEKEIRCYKSKLNVYGLPLDCRNTYSKSDWMIWASVLDVGDETLRLFSDTLTKMLAETTIRLPYPDLFETVAPSFTEKGHRPMYARTVQGGMWMPIYARMVAQNDKNNYLF